MRIGYWFSQGGQTVQIASNNRGRWYQRRLNGQSMDWVAMATPKVDYHLGKVTLASGQSIWANQMRNDFRDLPTD